MEIKKGIGVSPGVVIGTAVVLDAEDLVIPRRHVTAEQVTGEIQRFKDAVATAVVDLTRLRDAVAHQHGKEIGGIFDVHLAVLRDKSLMNQVVSEIRGQGPQSPQAAPPTQASHDPQAPPGEKGHAVRVPEKPAAEKPAAEKGAKDKSPADRDGNKDGKGNARGKAATQPPNPPPAPPAAPAQPAAEASLPVSAEYALSVVMRRYANKFSQMTDRYMSERVNDIYDIEKRLLRALIGQKREDLAHLTRPVVVIAHDLLPSQTAALDKEHVIGFATDVGGRTSHTAIVARAMGIPAVVGLGNVTAEVSGGDTVIIDGTHGVVIVNPDEEQKVEHVAAGKRQREADQALAKIAPEPAVTLDRHQVSLQANIEFPGDIDKALENGAEGIGLYRTEFLYLSRAAEEKEPTEEDHYEAYADALRRLKGKPLVIRTLDLGADKYTQAKSLNPERNPFLGDRSIRMCLHDIPMFKRQLRAIMRCSVLKVGGRDADVRIMFPMICTLMELRQAKMILNDVLEELEDEGIPFRRDIPVGMMVEVPSVAIMPDQFAREVQFFSIGTNDLIQYTLAVDRTNERVAGLFCPAHPAVLKLIRDVIRAAARNHISVSVCGEMAGDPLYTLLLLGLGLNIFSMNGPDVPEVKKIIRSTTVEHARQIARRVMSFDSERQVMHFLREETRKIIPEIF